MALHNQLAAILPPVPLSPDSSAKIQIASTWLEDVKSQKQAKYDVEAELEKLEKYKCVLLESDTEARLQAFIRSTKATAKLIELHLSFNPKPVGKVKKEIDDLQNVLNNLSSEARRHITERNKLMRDYEVDPILYLQLCAGTYTRLNATRRKGAIIANVAETTLLSYGVPCHSGGVFVEYLEILKPILGMDYNSKNIARKYFKLKQP